MGLLIKQVGRIDYGLKEKCDSIEEEGGRRHHQAKEEHDRAVAAYHRAQRTSLRSPTTKAATLTIG